jgi:nucleolar protein 56
MKVGTIIGTFTLNNNGKIVNHVQKKSEECCIKTLPFAKQKKLFFSLKDSQYFTAFRRENIAHTIKQLQKSINEDHLITHSIKNIGEIDKVINILVKRCREWYSLYCPEAAHQLTDHAVFIDMITSKSKKQLMKELNVQESMGTDLKRTDIAEIFLLAEQIKQLFKLKNMHESYVSDVCKKYCPNMQELCGTPIAAKLIAHAGSLRRLALLPSSTVQLLGAEKALFRHLTRKSRSPKHGFIVHHPIVQGVNLKDKGKAARALADKISLAARLDYFKGEFKAVDMRKELEKRFGVKNE